MAIIIISSKCSSTKKTITLIELVHLANIEQQWMRCCLCSHFAAKPNWQWMDNQYSAVGGGGCPWPKTAATTTKWRIIIRWCVLNFSVSDDRLSQVKQFSGPPMWLTYCPPREGGIMAGDSHLQCEPFCTCSRQYSSCVNGLVNTPRTVIHASQLSQSATPKATTVGTICIIMCIMLWCQWRESRVRRIASLINK